MVNRPFPKDRHGSYKFTVDCPHCGSAFTRIWEIFWRPIWACFECNKLFKRTEETHRVK